MSGPEERRFTDEEVAVILRRAADTELRADLPSPHGSTLADLMVAAEEVGLDPAAVRRAAAIRPAADEGLAKTALGAPDHREVVAVLEGTRLPEDRSDLVRVAERLLGMKGKVIDSTPERVVWREDHVFGRTTVTLQQLGNQTEVRVEADRAGHYLASWFAGLVGWGLVAGLTPLASLGPLATVASFAVLPLLLARPLWVRADRRLRPKLERAVLELARTLEEGAGGTLVGGEDPEALPGARPALPGEGPAEAG